MAGIEREMSLLGMETSNELLYKSVKRPEDRCELTIQTVVEAMRLEPRERMLF